MLEYIKKRYPDFYDSVVDHIRDVVKTKKSDHSIALGFAIGTFIALLPTPGFNILLGFLIVLIYRKVNKFALFTALAVWNPLVVAPFYALEYWIGNWLLEGAPLVMYDFVFLQELYQFTQRFLVGSLIVASIMSIISYYVVEKIVKHYKKTI